MSKKRNVILVVVLLGVANANSVEAAEHTFRVTIDRGRDLGQSFGTLFEATTADGELTVGAGFLNAYNTRYRSDRHAVQFFVRPASGDRKVTTQELPRPNNTMTGAYLFDQDGVIYSTYDGLKAWNPGNGAWRPAEISSETMRVGNGRLAFGDSRVAFNGRTILEPPKEGQYQKFFYSLGHLCFYHVTRRGKPYHHYIRDEDGYSRLYACPWTPDEPRVDLSKAITLRLPVVGETTFAWGQHGRQIVTGSNIGGFYVFEKGSWKQLLAPQLNRSYQLYSSLSFGERLLMGQYPTGRVFQYDGKQIGDQAGWPPVMPGVSGSAREAQTTSIYGGELIVGVWPWAEVWRYHPGSRRWTFTRRMFDHPQLSAKITHPYEVENEKHPVRNLWGQRVTSLIPNGPDLFVSTSSKGVDRWQPKKFPFLAPDKWKSYGKVYRLTMNGHLTAATRWTDGPTKLEFLLSSQQMTIRQDGKQLAVAKIDGPLATQVERQQAFAKAKWGAGLFGPFVGKSVVGKISRP